MIKALALVALVACNAYRAPDWPGAPGQPLDGADSTYKILTPRATQGTAWVIAPHYLISAGHVCKSGAGDYTLVTQFGLRSVANPVVWIDEDPVGGDPWDVCLLHSEAQLGPPMPLMYSMPDVGEEVEFVGYPNGKWTRSNGRYAGDVDGDLQWNNYFTTAPCDHGASGSALYTSDGVFGVLVRLRYDHDGVHEGTEGCVASPLTQIRLLLASIP